MSDRDDKPLSQDTAFLQAASELFALPPFGYAVTAVSGVILSANATLAAWLGYDAGELTPGMRLRDLLTPGCRVFYETHLSPILIAEGSADEIALDLVGKNQDVIPVLVNARHSRSASLNRWMIFKACERRTYERQLVSARNLFETTLSCIGDGVITTDAKGEVTLLNGVAAELCGWDPDLAAGLPIEAVLILQEEGTGAPVENPIRRALRSKQTVGLENHTILLAKDGRQFVIDDRASPILDEDGELLGAVMVFRDVTARRESERALQAAYQELGAKAAELRRSNEDLSQFAYAASHDLRSPLKTVTMYSQLIQRRYRDKLDEDGNTFLREIESATKRLGGLIEDLLAFSTVSANCESVSEPADVEAALNVIRGNLRAVIVESGATIDCETIPKLAVDETSLIQLFQNLIGNAIRYRSAAPPSILINAKQEDAFAHICCRDNGVGIPREHYQTIFEPFKRLHGHEVPGSGIGLALCRKVVERYGGRIWVESVVGEGSTFHFTLPLAAQQSASAVCST